MSWLQTLKNYLPKPVQCAEAGTELQSPFDPLALEDEYEAHQTTKVHKVPGFDQFFNSVLMVTANPEFNKGFKFDLSFPLSEYFMFSHSWALPNSGQPAEETNPMNPMAMMGQQVKPIYTFTTQLLRDIRGQEPYTIMMGKTDSDGKVEAFFIRRLMQNLSMRVTGSFQSSNLDQGMMSVDLDIEGKNSMGAIKFGQGHYGFSLMQRVHKNLILGFDYNNLMTQRLSFMSYGAKAFLNRHSLLLQYIGIQDQYNIGYIIPIKKGTQFVAHYKLDGRENKSSTILGFKQRYEQSQIMATLNSKGEITTTLAFKNPSYALKLCAMVDYMKEKYAFGYGITIGQTM